MQIARSRVELSDGNVVAAIRDLARNNRIANQLLQIPNTDAEKAALSIATRNFAFLQSLLSPYGPTTVSLEGVRILASGWPKPKPADFYAGSPFVVALSAISHVGEPGYSLERVLGSNRTLTPGNVAPELVREGLSARMIEFERQIMRVLRTPSPRFVDTVQRLRAVERADTAKDSTHAANRILPGFESIAAIGPTLEAQSECLLLGADTVRWWMMNSIHPLPSLRKYPDPFDTAKTLQVRAETPGFKVYSVGPNGLDDHAREGSDDIIFRHP